MITNFEIRNFRAFDHLCLNDLQRVNLIAGDNNVGKTALLEALWQFSGPDKPERAARLSELRGIQYLDPDEFLFDLFHDYNHLLPIELNSRNSRSKTAQTLRIFVQPRETSRITLAGDTQERDSKDRDLFPTWVESLHEVVLHYSEGNQEVESKGWLYGRDGRIGLRRSGIEVDRKQSIDKPPSYIFGARYRTPPVEEADRLGHMVLQGTVPELIAALRSFEPSMRGLTTITQNGNPVLLADLGLHRPIPTGLLGDGLQRILSIALAFGNASGGILLIDEVENGVHHSKLSEVWTAIFTFAREFDVQVFATTHSRGCVRAAHRVFSESDHYPFRYYRLDRVQGKIVAKTLDQEMLDTAIQMNLEVR